MNDEQLAKMAVHLLNCQSYVEGRTIFPCTDEMSIKDCTTSMDSDTWTSYHLMTNRVRAVCYTIKQTQFRGLAEQTVNKLMNTAQNQLRHLEKIEQGQEEIQRMAENTLDVFSKGKFSIHKIPYLKRLVFIIQEVSKRFVQNARTYSQHQYMKN